MLAEKSYSRIISVDRRPPAERIAGVEYIPGDVNKPIAIPAIAPGAEIYNFAAVHTTPGHQDWEYFNTNVWGAIQVCNFATAIGARSIFFTSSMAVYGPNENPLDESGPFDPQSAYGRSKLMAEAIHRNWCQAAPGRKLSIVRPAVIFGRGERGNFTRLAAAMKRRVFVFAGRDDTIKSCGYVGELVRSMLFVRDRPETEVTYNFAYPERYTIKDICRAMSSEAGYAMPRLLVPMWVMTLAGFGFEVLGKFGLKTSINRARMRKLTLSTNIVPKRLQELGYVFETDLRQGVAAWRRDAPAGEFV